MRLEGSGQVLHEAEQEQHKIPSVSSDVQINRRLADSCYGTHAMGIKVQRLFLFGGISPPLASPQRNATQLVSLRLLLFASIHHLQGGTTGSFISSPGDSFAAKATCSKRLCALPSPNTQSIQHMAGCGLAMSTSTSMWRFLYKSIK